MTHETITLAVEGPIARLSFNRPAVLNAFSSRLMEEVGAALAALTADKAVRAIVVTGEGRAFSAGFDLKESASRDDADVDGRRRQLERQFDFIIQFWDSPKPTVAVVHGYCLAGAFELALACDVTVAAEGTRFGEPEVRFGTGIIAMLLPWVAGPKRAKEILLTGSDRVDAEAALAMGIVNHVVPADQALAKGMAIARDMAAAAETSVLLTKRAINRTYDIMGMRQALLASLDIDMVLNASGGPERAEFNRIRREQGLKAALAWRDARFSR